MAATRASRHPAAAPPASSTASAPAPAEDDDDAAAAARARADRAAALLAQSAGMYSLRKRTRTEGGAAEGGSSSPVSPARGEAAGGGKGRKGVKGKGGAPAAKKARKGAVAEQVEGDKSVEPVDRRESAAKPDQLQVDGNASDGSSLTSLSDLEDALPTQPQPPTQPPPKPKPQTTRRPKKPARSSYAEVSSDDEYDDAQDDDDDDFSPSSTELPFRLPKRRPPPRTRGPPESASTKNAPTKKTPANTSKTPAGGAQPSGARLSSSSSTGRRSSLPNGAATSAASPPRPMLHIASTPGPPRYSTDFRPLPMPTVVELYERRKTILRDACLEAGKDVSLQIRSEEAIQTALECLTTGAQQTALCLAMNRYSAFCASPAVDIPVFPLTAPKLALFLCRCPASAISTLALSTFPQPPTFPLPVADMIDPNLTADEGTRVTRDLVHCWVDAFSYAQMATRDVWAPILAPSSAAGPAEREPHAALRPLHDDRAIREILGALETAEHMAQYEERMRVRDQVSATAAAGLASRQEAGADRVQGEGNSSGKGKGKGKEKEKEKEKDGSGAQENGAAGKTKWVKGGRAVPPPMQRGSSSSSSVPVLGPNGSIPFANAPLSTSPPAPADNGDGNSLWETTAADATFPRVDIFGSASDGFPLPSTSALPPVDIPLLDGSTQQVAGEPFDMTSPRVHRRQSTSDLAFAANNDAFPLPAHALAAFAAAASTAVMPPAPVSSLGPMMSTGTSFDPVTAMRTRSISHDPRLSLPGSVPSGFFLPVGANQANNILQSFLAAGEQVLPQYEPPAHHLVQQPTFSTSGSYSQAQPVPYSSAHRGAPTHRALVRQPDPGPPPLSNGRSVVPPPASSFASTSTGALMHSAAVDGMSRMPQYAGWHGGSAPVWPPSGPSPRQVRAPSSFAFDASLPPPSPRYLHPSQSSSAALSRFLTHGSTQGYAAGTAPPSQPEFAPSGLSNLRAYEPRTVSYSPVAYISSTLSSSNAPGPPAHLAHSSILHFDPIRTPQLHSSIGGPAPDASHATVNNTSFDVRADGDLTASLAAPLAAAAGFADAGALGLLTSLAPSPVPHPTPESLATGEGAAAALQSLAALAATGEAGAVGGEPGAAGQAAMVGEAEYTPVPATAAAEMA